MQLVQHKKLLIKGDTTVGKQLVGCSVAKEIAPKEWPRSPSSPSTMRRPRCLGFVKHESNKPKASLALRPRCGYGYRAIGNCVYQHMWCYLFYMQRGMQCHLIGAGKSNKKKHIDLKLPEMDYIGGNFSNLSLHLLQNSIWRLSYELVCCQPNRFISQNIQPMQFRQISDGLAMYWAVLKPHGNLTLYQANC